MLGVALKTTIMTLCFICSYHAILYVWTSFSRHLNKARSERELPAFINNMIHALRAGISPIAFFSNYANANTSLQITLQNLMKRIRGGHSLADALEKAAQEVPSPLYHYLFSAINLGIKNGGNLSKVLEKVRQTSLARIDLKRLTGTKTAQLKLQAHVITLLPLLIAGWMSIAYPHKLTGVFQTASGIKVFVLCISFEATGIAIVYRLLASPLKYSSLHDLIYFLDLLSVVMSSGKSFPSSLICIQEIRLPERVRNFIDTFHKSSTQGRTLIESFSAIKSFFPRHTCEQMLFILKENLDHGVPIRQLLDEISTQLREELISDLTIKIEKLPVKLLAPLMLLIAPATLVLIIFPVIFM